MYCWHFGDEMNTLMDMFPFRISSFPRSFYICPRKVLIDSDRTFAHSCTINITILMLIASLGFTLWFFFLILDDTQCWNWRLFNLIQSGYFPFEHNPGGVGVLDRRE